MKSLSHVHWSGTDAVQHSSERWNAASGYLVIGLGIAGAAFERGSPPFTAPVEEVVAFWCRNTHSGNELRNGEPLNAL
jgi:hypothetical protein